MFKIFHFFVLLLFALSFFRLPSLAHDVVRPGHRYLKDEVFLWLATCFKLHGRGRRTGHKVNYLLVIGNVYWAEVKRLCAAALG